MGTTKAFSRKSIIQLCRAYIYTLGKFLLGLTFPCAPPVLYIFSSDPELSPGDLYFFWKLRSLCTVCNVNTKLRPTERIPKTQSPIGRKVTRENLR
jgi:hypothetical protein